MAIVDHGGVDLLVLQERLQAWLRGQPGEQGMRVLSLRQASHSNGFSNETYRVTLAGERRGEEELVLRLPPMRIGMFPSYDLARQYAFMQRLAAEPGLAMAPCRWLEQDPQALGRPFFLTTFVDGQVAGDQPKYVNAGWVREADESQRRCLWDSSVDQLVRLSQVRWHGKALADLDWPDRQAPRLRQHIEWWSRTGAWGAQALPAQDDPFKDRLASWLVANMPPEEVAGVVWGDGRFGNIIYRDFRPVALLDWELAFIGDPMCDLAYMLFHVFLTELYHTPGEPRLAGFRGDEATLLRYCEATGRSPQHYRYWWLFNAYKMLCIWQCKAALMLRSGAWTLAQAQEGARGELLRDVTARVLAGGEDAALLR